MHRWHWRVAYDDGSSISQTEINPATGREWSSSHADIAKTKALILEPISDAWRVIVQVGAGERFVRFWRHYVYSNGPLAGQKYTTWVVGLEKNEHVFYNFFRQEDMVISSDKEHGSELRSGCSIHDWDQHIFVHMQSGERYARQKNGLKYIGKEVFYNFFRYSDKTMILTSNELGYEHVV